MYQYAETYEGEVTHDTHGPTKVSSAIEQVDIGTNPLEIAAVQSEI